MDNSFNSLPSGTEPLEGEVCMQYIRCGKSGCRCQSGQLHGPYYYRVWREGTQVRKVYVRSSEVEAIKTACQTYHTLSRSLRDVKQTRIQLTRSIQKEWRRTQRLMED